MDNDKINKFFDGTSEFEVAINAFTAMDIARSAPVVDSNEIIYDAWEWLMSDEEEIAIVKEKDKIIGFIQMFGGNGADFHEVYLAQRQDMEKIDYWSKKTISDIAEPILPYHLIPPSMKILGLIPKFKEENFLFILEKKIVTHYVTFNDLDKFPVNICLFSLISYLDSKLLSRLIASPVIKDYYDKLPRNMRDKIDKLARANYKGKDLDNIPINYKLKYTNILEKYKLFEQTTGYDKSLPENILRVFKSLVHNNKKIRNLIAHGDSVFNELKDPQEYANFVDTLKFLIFAFSGNLVQKNKNKFQASDYRDLDEDSK